MSPASARRLRQEDMQQATIKRRLAQWRASHMPPIDPFAEMSRIVVGLIEARGGDIAAEQQPEGPRH